MQLRDLVSTKGRKAVLEARRLLPIPRALPDFMVIGAQKSGTSSMFTYLKQHPQILRPLVKEPYFFDRNYDRGLGWYRCNFPTTYAIKQLNERTGQPHLTFEATATYVFNPEVPERIARDLDTRRFIALLRNPADRAISAYWHAMRQGIETRSLDEAIADDLARYEAEAAFQNGDGPVLNGPAARPSYLKRGIYHKAMTSWQRFFKSEDILVIQSENMFVDPANVMKQVFNFLNLPLPSEIDYEPQNVGLYRDIDAKTKDFLTAFYKPHNETLYSITGRPFSW